MRIFYHIGCYLKLMLKVLQKPDKRSVFFNSMLREIDAIGIQSIGIVAIISVFMGAVTVIQTADNIDGPLTPMYLVGFTAAQTIILEFSSTVVSLILAGKVGSRIASEIGTMRVTEQIDALEIMGINSANYLILPKLVGAVFIFPFLTIISMIVGIGGAFIVNVMLNITPYDAFLYGMKLDFVMFDVFYSIIKSMFFAVAIATVPSYHGYFAKGSALDVGKASTKSVVFCSITILIINYVITQLFLS